MTLRISPDTIVRTDGSALLRVHPSWNRVRLGEVARVTNGFAFKSERFNSVGRGIPLIRIRDVAADATATWFDGDWDPDHVVRSGEIVVGMDGDFRIARWRGPEALLNQRVCRIRLRDTRYDERFLLYVLPGYLNAIHRHTSSVTVKHLSSNTLLDLPLPNPPLSEQLRIVEAIEEKFSRLDAATASIGRARTVLSKLHKATFSAISGIVSAPNISDATPSIVLPQSWRWMRAAAACSSINSGSTPNAALMSSTGGDVPFLKVYNLTMDGLLDFTIKPTYIARETHEGALARSRVRPRDVLTNIVGPPLGKVSIVPDLCPEWNINQAIVAFRPGPQLVARFLTQCLLSDVIQRPLLATGKATAGQTNLSLTNCRNMWLPVPPLAEQVRVADEIESRHSKIADLLGAVHRAAKRSANLRRAILETAFSGRLVAKERQSNGSSWELSAPRDICPMLE